MSDLFVELGVEEIPARMMEDALKEVRAEVRSWAENRRLLPKEGDPASAGVRAVGTPRRLVVEATLRGHQRARVQQIKGPPEQVAYDEGEPTPALEGFLRQHDLESEDADVEELDGGSYVVARVERRGSTLEDCLREDLVDLVLGLDWPKSMRWESSNVRFVRPLRWLVCLVDDEPLDLRVGPVESGTESRGLRFTDRERFRVETTKQYREVLKEQGIVLDQTERSRRIRRQVEDRTEDVNGEPVLDPSLLEEVTHLVEAPEAFLGTFSERFLAVPDVVLRKAMVSHQKYVPVEDDDGDLMPYFVGVRNGSSEGIDVVREGNEKVIRARLADAEFFYVKDREREYESYREDLEGVVFQEELGSLYDKTERLGVLAEQVEEEEGLPDWFSRAARHAKNDLVTSMVEEFPDLQGTVGRIYAGESGWNPDASRVIEEHHAPSGREDDPAGSYPGAWLAVLDRLDTLVGFFRLGERPTGSSDPYGLRRDALGVLRTMLEHDLDRRLPTMIEEVMAVHVDSTSEGEAVLSELPGFFRERLEHLFLERDHEPYRVGAAVNLERWSPSGCQVRVRWLAEHEMDPTLQSVAEMAGRVKNILASAEDIPDDSDADLLDRSEERRLIRAVDELELNDFLDRFPEPRDLDEAVDALADVVEPVNDFFDEIMVMAEEEPLRRARLALLAELAGDLDRVVDFGALDPIL